jgi:hypothetical protein
VNLTDRRSGRIALAAVAATGAFSLTFAVTRLRDDGPRRYDDDRSVAALDLPTSNASHPQPTATSDPAATPSAPRPGRTLASSSSPEAAVAAFLSAERAGDFAGSFALLSGTEQRRSDLTEWTARHADLPEIVDFRVTGAPRPTTGRVEVTARATLRPLLDEVVGLVPATADLTLATVREGDGWRVMFSESRFAPVYLDDATAAGDTRDWVEQRAGCAPAEEYAGGLLGAGAVTLAAQLCDADGAIAVGAPERLPDSPDSDPYVAAFGPDVLDWARVVPVSSPAPIDVVVAPVGERWLVIGASSPTA